MSNRVVTSADVARQAGVSRSAVSRCFTPGTSVSHDMRRRVMDAAKALGYRPNAIARSLNMGRSRMIAVVLGAMENPFYPALLERLAVKMQALQYRLLLFTAPPDGNCDDLFSEIFAYRVDGLILASVLLTSALTEECHTAGVPLVLVNRTTEDPNVSSVIADNRTGARSVADFLVAGGHKRFAYLAGLQSASTNQDREVAFRGRLAQFGIDDVLIDHGNYRREGAQDATRRLLLGANPPDAIFCANDHMALAAIDVARYELNLRIPDDVSIVGYDDVPAAAWLAYRLTTVEQPVDAMAEATVNLLMRRIEGKGAGGERIRMNGDLIVRSSARRPAAGIAPVDGRDLWRP